MSDIAHHVNVSGKYSLEFEPSGLHCIVSIRFWKADTLCTVRLMQYRLASDHAAGLLTAIAHLLILVSTAAIGQCVLLSVGTHSHFGTVGLANERNSIPI